MNIKKYLSAGLIAAALVGALVYSDHAQSVKLAERRQEIQQEKLEQEKRDAEAKRLADEQRAAEIEANRRNAEENRRKLEEQFGKNRERAQQTPQQEPAPITVYTTAEEFNSRLEDRRGGVPLNPSATTNENGMDKIVYPLDASVNVYMIEWLISGTDDLKAVDVRANNLNPSDIVTVMMLYASTIRAFDPAADAQTILNALNLNETALENLKQPQSTVYNGKRYSKKFINPHLVLSISEQ